MNPNFVAATLVVLACCAGSRAYADDITIDPHPFVSTASRAQVREELAEFRRSGVNWMADDYNPLNQFHSTLTRAEVQAQFMASRNAVAAFSAEDSGSAYLARNRFVPRALPEYMGQSR